MLRLSKKELVLFASATLAGACLHFLYTLFPCVGTALAAPVRESLWEHVKLIYWPCLISGLLLRRQEPGLLGQRAFALLAAAAGMLAAGWVWHICLRGRSLWFDIALYVLAMALFFLLPHGLRQSFWRRFRGPLALLAAALGAATLLFTFLPPGGPLFADLSAPAAFFTVFSNP